MAKLGYDKTRAEHASFGLVAMDTMETMPAGIIHRPEGLAQWLFVVFYDRVDIKLNGKIQTYDPAQLVIWPAGHEHYFGNTSKRWSHSWFFANGDAIDTSIRRSGLPIETCIPIHNRYQTDQFFNDLYQEMSAYSSIHDDIVKQTLDIWLQRLQRDRAGQTQQQSRFVELQRYIENNLEQQLSLEHLAKHIGLSISHLSSEFKKHCQCSPIEYVLRSRLERARFLLSDHNNRIADIAARVGFQDVFHFSKMFKKRFGLSPRNLRKAKS